MKIIGTMTSRAGRSRLRTVIGLIAAVVMTLSLVAPGSAGATGGGQSGGVSANPVFGPLSAKWWQWLMSIPGSTNPATHPDAECNQHQSGKVFFLAGAFDDTAVTRDCIVDGGKALFFPLINIANFATDKKKDTVESLWSDLHTKNDWKATSLYLIINDVSILEDAAPSGLYRGCAGPERGCSPRSFAVKFPKDTVFLPKGTYNPTVADGYYGLIPPLPRGQYTISFGGTGTWIPDPDNPEITNIGQNVTYNLTVK